MLSFTNRNTMNKSILSLATVITSCLVSTLLKGDSDDFQTTINSLEKISAPEEKNTLTLKDIISSSFLQPESKKTSNKGQNTNQTKKDLFAEDLMPFNEVDPWD